MPDTSIRPLRVCMACGQVDDHPRHNIGVPADHPQAVPSKEFLAGLPDGTPAAAIAHVLLPTQISRHLDCCAAAGCVLCQETEAITKGKRGQALIDAIDKGALDDHEPSAELTNKELGIDG